VKQEKFYNDLSETIEKIYECDGKNVCLKGFKKNDSEKSFYLRGMILNHNGRVYYKTCYGWTSIIRNRDNDFVKTLVALQVNFGDN